jgi:hypothetical protein
MSNQNTQQPLESFWPTQYHTIPGGYQGSIKAYQSIERARTTGKSAGCGGCAGGFENFTYNANANVHRPIDGFGRLSNYDPVQYMTVTPGYWRSQGTYMIHF